MIEQRRLKEQLNPLNENLDTQELLDLMGDFTEPEELQGLLQLAVRRIAWKANGNPKVPFYVLPKRVGVALKAVLEGRQEGAQNAKTKCPSTQSVNGHRLYTDV